MVGVGAQAAPLFGLAEQRWRKAALRAHGGGRRDRHTGLGVLDARRSAQSVTVTTKDGSVGIRGDVTALLAGLLDRNQIDAVRRSPHGHGPGGDVRRDPLRGLGAGAGRRAHAVRDRVVRGCVLPVRGEDGIARAVRACYDGPVLPGEKVDWEAVP